MSAHLPNPASDPVIHCLRISTNPSVCSVGKTNTPEIKAMAQPEPCQCAGHENCGASNSAAPYDRPGEKSGPGAQWNDNQRTATVTPFARRQHGCPRTVRSWESDFYFQERLATSGPNSDDIPRGCGYSFAARRVTRQGEISFQRTKA